MNPRKLVWLMAVVAIQSLTLNLMAATQLEVIGVSHGRVGDQERLTVTFQGQPVFKDFRFENSASAYILFENARLAGDSQVLDVGSPLIQEVILEQVKDPKVEQVRLFIRFEHWSPYAIATADGSMTLSFSAFMPATQPSEVTVRQGEGDRSPQSESEMLVLKGDASVSDQPVSLFDKYQSLKTSLGAEPLVLAQETAAPGAAGGSKSTDSSAGSFVPPAGTAQKSEGETGFVTFQDPIFDQRVDLTFKDQDIQNVLRLIASRTGLNILMSPKQVSGTVTLQLRNVRLGTALDSILKVNDLAYVREADGIIRIVPLSEVQTSKIELKTEIIELNWVPATGLKRSIEPFLTKNGKIEADEFSNSLIVVDSPPNLETIRLLIKKIDVPEKQVMIEARLVEVNSAVTKSFNINWSVLRSDQQGASPLTGVLNTFIPGIPATPDTINPITGEIIEGTAATADSFGALSGPVEGFLSGSQQGQSDGGQFAFGTTVGGYQLGVALAALENNNMVEILQAPKVITLNNIKATMEIIQKIPYSNSNIVAGSAQTETWVFEESGVNIGVTPNVTPNGYVRMLLEVAQKINRGPVIARNPRSAPQIDERKANTNVIVKDEETVVIGGLRDLQSREVISGVPYFHRIPVLGWLFKSKLNQTQKTDLILFVTPQVIKDPVLTDTDLARYNKIDRKWQLPDYFFDDTRTDTDK
ncbi:MAG: secretin and TonB N-terminal domain-containing protein [bacterium]